MFEDEFERCCCRECCCCSLDDEEEESINIREASAPTFSVMLPEEEGDEEGGKIFRFRGRPLRVRLPPPDDDAFDALEV